MDSRILTPIPTPPAQRWRQFRLLYLPRALFIAAVALIIWMWGHAIAPSAIVAEAEVLGTDLRATDSGVLTSLKVVLNQPVRAGDVVGQITTGNPRLLEATLAVVRAEVAMLTATMAGVTDRQRVALDFERLQLEWMAHRVERAELQGRVQQNEADLARAEPLYRAKLITEESFTQLKITHDTLVAQLAETNNLIARLEPVLPGIKTSDLSGESALAAGIKVEEAKLKLAEEELAPISLVVPIDGVVSLLLRRPGEPVVGGDVILRIVAPKSERLAGYLRQPLAFEPKPGMAAEIRTRGVPQKTAPTTITHVGVALEPITPSLLTAMRLPLVPAPETAIRVEFSLPKDLALRPGEHVDIILR